MKTVGIIAEYNPFHSGHAYQLAEAKRLTGADYAVVVMSGDFVQRGTPAIMDKYLRTRAALLGGADVIFELPVCFAVASAEYFAEGAVALLSALGVDSLCFGSECGDIRVLTQIASILAEESSAFKETLSAALRSGESFPVARAKACAAQFREQSPGSDIDVLSLLSQPNNLLGIEYCKALLRLNSPVRPFTISRIGNAYHEEGLSTSFSSATALRSVLEDTSATEEEILSRLSGQVPNSVLPVIRDALNDCLLLDADKFSSLLSYRLLTETEHSLCSYPDWNAELANRLYSVFRNDMTFSDTALSLKSKQITLTRANRMLLRVLLQCNSALLTSARAEGSCFYARLLGFGSTGSDCLKLLKKSSTVPIINKPAPAAKALTDTAGELFALDIRAAEIYRLVQLQYAKTIPGHELTRGIIML